MSSIEGLLSEVRPNLEIIQIIKAADQLYYKDRTLYTDIKPELPERGGKKEEGKKQKQQAETKEEDKNEQPQQKHDAQQQKHQKKKEKKEKKEKNKKGGDGESGATNATVHPEPKTVIEEIVSSGSSKLQQAIEQAKKTVEQALNLGSNGTVTTSTGVDSVVGNHSGAIDEELSRLKAENTQLRTMLESREKRLARLEKISQKLLGTTGMKESDFSD